MDLELLFFNLYYDCKLLNVIDGIKHLFFQSLRFDLINISTTGKWQAMCSNCVLNTGLFIKAQRRNMKGHASG